MRREFENSRFLTIGAIKGGALCLHDAAYGRFAAPAWQASTVINHGFKLEVALLTVRI